MTLTIETAQNGFILKQDDGFTFVVGNDDPAEATCAMLREVLELVGHIGSRYDEWRVQVIMEHGDKWISPEEAVMYPVTPPDEPLIESWPDYPWPDYPSAPLE